MSEINFSLYPSCRRILSVRLFLYGNCYTKVPSFSPVPPFFLNRVFFTSPVFLFKFLPTLLQYYNPPQGGVPRSNDVLSITFHNHTRRRVGFGVSVLGRVYIWLFSISPIPSNSLHLSASDQFDNVIHTFTVAH